MSPVAWPKWNGVVRIDEESLKLPAMWKTGRMIFVNSMSDLFHETVPLEFIQRVFTTMSETSQHTYQILTKRAERLEELSDALEWPRKRLDGCQRRKCRLSVSN